MNDFLFARGQYINGTCGGSDNEDCLRAMVSSFDVNWDLLVSEIHALAPSATMRTMNIYYAVAAYDEGSGNFSILNPYLSQMNAHILSNPGGPVADVHLVYNGPKGTDDPYAKGYILSDGVHPNWLGHVVIALRLATLGYAGLPPGPTPTCPSGTCSPNSVRRIAEQPDATALPFAYLDRIRRPSHGLRVGGTVLAAVITISIGSWYVGRKGKTGTR